MHYTLKDLDSTPLVFINTPFSVKRATLVIEHMAPLLGRHKVKGLNQELGNIEISSAIRDACSSFSQAIYHRNGLISLEKVKNLAANEWTTLHGVLDLNCLSTCQVKLLVQMRDPRDLLTSALWRTYIKEKRKDITQEIFGKDLTTFLDKNTVSNRVQYVKPLLDMFMYAHEHPEIATIRFEDFHIHPYKTYKFLFEELKWWYNHHTENESLQQTLKLIIKKSLPENFMKHKAEFQAYTQWGVRKGSVGDWKNWWSEELKNRYKDLAGDTLIALGYTQDHNW